MTLKSRRDFQHTVLEVQWKWKRNVRIRKAIELGKLINHLIHHSGPKISQIRQEFEL